MFPLFPLLFAMKWWGQMPWSLLFEKENIKIWLSSLYYIERTTSFYYAIRTLPYVLFKFLLWFCVLVTQSCPTLCDLTDCTPPGFSVHGILQARVLEWIAIPFSRGTSQPRDWTLVSCLTGRFFTIWATGKSLILGKSLLSVISNNIAVLKFRFSDFTPPLLLIIT